MFWTDSWNMVARTTTPSINPQVYIVGTRSWAIIDVETQIPCTCFSQHHLRSDTTTGYCILGKPLPGFYLGTHGCEGNGDVPGYRESTGKALVLFFLPSGQVLVLSLQWPGTCSGSSLFSWTCSSGSHFLLWGADLQLWHLTRPCAPKVAPRLTYQPRTRARAQNTDHLTVKISSRKTGVMTPQPNPDL